MFDTKRWLLPDKRCLRVNRRRHILGLHQTCSAEAAVPALESLASELKRRVRYTVWYGEDLVIIFFLGGIP